MTQLLVTLHTRTPLHIGCGTSVDVVDLPLMRERITNFPVIPSTSLKGVLLQAGRDLWPSTWVEKKAKPKEVLDLTNQILFGAMTDEKEGDSEVQKAHAGCLQIMEGKLLAFPVRSLAGCFAWLTCPAILHRFKRDTGKTLSVPPLQKDQAVVGQGSEAVVPGQKAVVLEEYALSAIEDPAHAEISKAFGELSDDPLWKDKIAKRLVILHDEDFQHFVSTCTEVVARIVMDPKTRTNQNLFNQENIPCETLFYTVIAVHKPRRTDGQGEPGEKLNELLAANPTLQIGGDETTGHGFCEIKPITL